MAVSQLAQLVLGQLLAAVVCAQEPVLMTLNALAESDVKGNLGAAAVVTSPRKDDWLKDRWQAAMNMQGKPIPGPHWVTITIPQRYTEYRPTKIVLDWETAYASSYKIEVSADGRTFTPILSVQQDHTLPTPILSVHPSTSEAERHGVEISEAKETKQHIVHTITLGQEIHAEVAGDSGVYGFDILEIKYVKVTIQKLGTQYGASLWGFEVWGSPRS